MSFAALADDFNFESRISLGQRSRHIAEREGLVDPMSVRSRGDPTDGLAIVPARLIPEGVGVARIGLEGHQAQGAAASLLLGTRRAPDELAFLEVDEWI